MKVSHAWLQTYFDKPLPEASELAELLTFHAFEIEGVEEAGEDSVIDVDVLSNRSSDCLCHRGIAKELAVLLSRTNEFNTNDPFATLAESVAEGSVAIRIDAPTLVNRFSVARVQGVKVGPSPAWLKTRLEAIGQRSINNIVDATNYVMFSLGQPLHAFDANKLLGDTKTLAVRVASVGEKITTLTNDVYELDPTTLLIVDGTDNTPLAIAGVKGGKHAEVDAHTTDIILEAANFNFVSVRKTSRALKLQTDASVRFQNQPVPELTVYALQDVVALITDIAGGTHVGGTDWYPAPRTHNSVSVTRADILKTLGTEFSHERVSDIFTRFGWHYVVSDDVFTVTPPFERTDIVYTEDLIEEIGRVDGYMHLPSATLAPDQTTVTFNSKHEASERIRRALVVQGFSEVLTYQLRDKGELMLANALAADKSNFRATLLLGMREALDKNAYYAPLLGIEQVKLFEIGTVWRDGKEQLMLSVGIHLTKKVKGKNATTMITEALEACNEILPNRSPYIPHEGIVEIPLFSSSENDPVIHAYTPVETAPPVQYTPFSAYPFVLRDIACWTDQDGVITKEDIERVITEHGGSLLVRVDLFDEFSKENRTSYAYHLVFQANDRTLTDTEVGTIMEDITSALSTRGCDIR